MTLCTLSLTKWFSVALRFGTQPQYLWIVCVFPVSLQFLGVLSSPQRSWSHLCLSLLQGSRQWWLWLWTVQNWACADPSAVVWGEGIRQREDGSSYISIS